MAPNESRVVILRPVRMSDWQFLVEAYSDWPISDKGPMLPQKVVENLRYWLNRKGRTCLIADDPEPVGMILFRQFFFVAVVDNLIVHPDHRGQGHARAMWESLYDRLTSEGVVAAEFDAIPGAIAAKIEEGSFGRGEFEKAGEGVGPHTGLPIVRGRVVASTD